MRAPDAATSDVLPFVCSPPPFPIFSVVAVRALLCSPTKLPSVMESGRSAPFSGSPGAEAANFFASVTLETRSNTRPYVSLALMDFRMLNL